MASPASEPPISTTGACPYCGRSDRLESQEVTTAWFPIRLTRGHLEYDADLTFDIASAEEAATPTRDDAGHLILFCHACASEFPTTLEFEDTTPEPDKP